MTVMLTIPPRLEELLTTAEYAGSVRSFASAVSTILDDNKMPFFPGYTDHGRHHVEAVLRTIEKLIPKDVWTAGILTGSDATVLVCAALLHDLPMHLGEEGFFALTSGVSGHQPLSWFEWRPDKGSGDKPWPELWDDFTMESRRWGDEMLVRVFGPRVMQSEWTVGRIAANRAEWSEYDRLWIGEFIRRHHGRLAHEIAHYGFPGLWDETPGTAVPVLRRDTRIPYDLAGLTARSHTMELRECVEYLKWKHAGDLRPFGAVPVYLMALLRVADYLQLDSARAPMVLLRLRGPQSPISVDEWNKHGAVADISWEHRDPQAISINVEPSHSYRTHLQLAGILVDLQREMDISAAVVRETYGLAACYRLDQLRLAKTRVVTNIHDPALTSQLGYVPRKASFSADPHLLSLLVEPLYGDSPQIGVRELLQNSVDAVRERLHFCERHGIDRATLQYPDQDADVVIELQEQSDGTWLLVVRDKGIGMKESTIRDYFLRAGASFRNCTAWTKEYTDNEGHPEVPRSGRFGVGAFAAFLLSSEISVSTRHVAESIGYRFIARRGAELIEIQQMANSYMGTTVTLVLQEKAAEELLRRQEYWDWYVLDEPAVVRRVKYKSGRQRKLKQHFRYPDPEGKKPAPGWRFLEPKGFGQVAWSKRSPSMPALSCNGIIISNADSLTDPDHEVFYWRTGEHDSLIAPPAISLLDPFCRLPLRLQRDWLLADTLPFEKELLEDIVTDFIAYCLACAPSAELWASHESAREYLSHYPLDEYSYAGGSRLRWLCTNDGSAPLDPHIFARLCPGTVVLSGLIGYAHLDSGEQVPLWAFSQEMHRRIMTLPYDMVSRYGGPIKPNPDTLQREYASAVTRLLNMPIKAGMIFDGQSSVHGTRRYGFPVDSDNFSARLTLVIRDPLPEGLKEIVPSSVHSAGRVEIHNVSGYRAVTVTRHACQEWAIEPEAIIASAADVDCSRWIPFALEFPAVDEPELKRESIIARRWREVTDIGYVPFEPRARAQLIERALSHDTHLADHFNLWKSEKDMWLDLCVKNADECWGELYGYMAKLRRPKRHRKR